MDSRPYLIWLAIASCVTFFLYGYDKAQAGARGRRVPEGLLHALALAGGFAGGWLGRWAFRHKTRKWSLTLILAVSTAVHLGLGYWLFFR